MLTAHTSPYGIYVQAADGRCWYPNSAAEDAIERAARPLERAVEICEVQPERGTWAAPIKAVSLEDAIAAIEAN